MLKNDYMKEVEDTLKLIREKINRNIINNEIVEAKELLNEEIKKLIGLDIETIDMFSFESIIDLISKSGQYNTEKYIAFGELMNLEGIISSKENDEFKEIEYYQKSLDGFYLAYSEDDDISKKYLEEACEMCQELSKYNLDINYDKKILKLYEMANKLDKAEDTLFYMLQKTNNDGSIILEGMRFYNRLKEKDKEELSEGNLPLEEVEDGVAELERRLGL